MLLNRRDQRTEGSREPDWIQFYVVLLHIILPFADLGSVSPITRPELQRNGWTATQSREAPRQATRHTKHHCKSTPAENPREHVLGGAFLWLLIHIYPRAAPSYIYNYISTSSIIQSLSCVFTGLKTITLRKKDSGSHSDYETRFSGEPGPWFRGRSRRFERHWFHQAQKVRERKRRDRGDRASYSETNVGKELFLMYNIVVQRAKCGEWEK